MDYTEISCIERMAAIAQGVTEEQIDRAETLYFDETDNVKHLVLLPSKQINAGTDTCFVLGGVQAEDVITDAELHAALDKATGRELKASKDLRGNFIDILRKGNLSRALSLVNDKGWYIHFSAIQVWYFAFVDIIDSINEDINVAFQLKAIIYKILKTYNQDTVRVFGKYHYPNIKDKDVVAFIEELLEIVEKFIKSCHDEVDSKRSEELKNILINAKTQEKLIFIQDETPDEWVKKFVEFYRYKIALCPNKSLIFDTEKQVENILKDNPIEIEGKKLNNFHFVDSASNPMIQVCDYVVCILRKYFVFLDRSLKDVIADIENFDEIQMKNYKMLNNILKRSIRQNPLYFHYIASVDMQSNLNQLMDLYY